MTAAQEEPQKRRYPYRCAACGFTKLDPDQHPHCPTNRGCDWAVCPKCKAVNAVIIVHGKQKIVFIRT